MWRVVRTDHGVQVALCPEGPSIDLIEHALAAFVGLGITRGIAVDVEGGEVPLLDGGAHAFAHALESLARSDPPAVTRRVTRSFAYRSGDSEYFLAPAAAVHVTVDVAFTHRLIGSQRATWHGDPGDFLRRIAPARTFGFLGDAERLQLAGRAHHVDPAAVVVFTPHGLLPGSYLVGADEPARHKLLDLLGDLAIYGGAIQGHLHAIRPGHTATHALMVAAQRAGVIADNEK